MFWNHSSFDGVRARDAVFAHAPAASWQTPQIVAPLLRDRDAVRVAGLLAAALPGAGYSPPSGY